MKINYKHSTATSNFIIYSLIKSGHKLTDSDKQLIIEKIYDAIMSASSWESNGCDCGQVSCPICGS